MIIIDEFEFAYVYYLSVVVLRLSYLINDEATRLCNCKWVCYKSKMEISLAYKIIEILELDYLYQDNIVPQNVLKKD
jgi:hypothetical protein